jgi:hypothetical protein
MEKPVEKRTQQDIIELLKYSTDEKMYSEISTRVNSKAGPDIKIYRGLYEEDGPDDWGGEDNNAGCLLDIDAYCMIDIIHGLMAPSVVYKDSVAHSGGIFIANTFPLPTAYVYSKLVISSVPFNDEQATNSQEVNNLWIRFSPL